MHAPYMTFTALNDWTILLLDITHWLANSTRELCTTASADGSDRSIKIPDILSRLAKPKKFILLEGAMQMLTLKMGHARK